LAIKKLFLNIMWIKKIFLAILLTLPAAAQAAPTPRIPLPNPLQANSIPELSGDVIRGLLGITGAISLFMMVWGGLVWMTSQGNAEKLKKGKDTVLWTILGLIIIFLSYVILNFIFTIIGGNA
jgi:hypothetical protein